MLNLLNFSFFNSQFSIILTNFAPAIPKGSARVEKFGCLRPL